MSIRISQLKFLLINSKAFFDSFCLVSSSIISSLIAAIISSGFSGGINTPVSPFVTNSEFPPTSVAITGTTSGAWVLHGDHNQLAYTKIGRKVTVIGKYETSSGSGAGSLKISLPFTPAQLGNSGGVAAGSITVNRVGSGNNITVQLTPIAFENTAFLQIQMHNEDASASENYLQADDIDGAFEGQIGITYFT